MSSTYSTSLLPQHALAHARSPSVDQGIRPICFVTVSPRLRKELARRYNEIEALEKISLPPVKFFSLRELLDGLLQTSNADIKMSDACNFLEYVHSRKSYVDLVVESSEVENEIGGVIMGSLEAALKKSPLTRDEYISNKRSNVSGDSEEGRAKRHAIYDE